MMKAAKTERQLKKLDDFLMHVLHAVMQCVVEKKIISVRKDGNMREVGFEIGPLRIFI